MTVQLNTDELMALGRLPLTETGWSCVVSWMGRVSAAELHKVAPFAKTKKQLAESLSWRLRVPTEAATERELVERGRILRALAKSKPRCFLRMAPEGLGTYVQGAKGVLSDDPVLEEVPD